MRKTFLGNSKKKKFSQMSAVRTGVRAYMDATPLHGKDISQGQLPEMKTSSYVLLLKLKREDINAFKKKLVSFF